ncbi:hypothetical protein RJ639_043631 [Escallonia herrerae]|uniref:Uncharacterized protein n=1 Tax=Escallonia herrerae TaxID=1293975 RepID=A0AA89B1R6_9ASTE|nr:hypothetical protein RJ639_043631 [Escallonia herrerae]
MSKGGARHHHHNYHKDNGLGLPKQLAEPPDGPTEKLESQSKLKGCVSASQSTIWEDLPPDSRTSQALFSFPCDEKQDAPYIPAVTPTTSLDFEHTNRKASYSHKTSTELLKVLNRIWSLEKQHASNILYVKALKRELNHSQARLKELLQEKKRDRVEIDDLMKQIKGNEVFRKKREQDRINAVTDELEDERKLRKHSENIHRKLGRELSEVRSSFSNAPKELGGERKARILLENFCDELAKVPSGKQRDGCSGHHCEKASISHPGDEIKSNLMEKKTPSAEVIKARDQSSCQMQFEEHSSGKVGVENPNEVDNSQKLERSEVTAGGSKGRENRQVGAPEMDSCRENKSPDPEVSESSSKWPPAVKENTLKAKLLEARLESQRSRSKASKGHI